MSAEIIHVVSSLQGLSGAETHSATLVRCLSAAGAQVMFWSDRSSPVVVDYGAKVISPFTGSMPRGGTLILVGAYLKLMPWITYARPRRLILVCINSDPISLHQTLGVLGHEGLPEPEIVYVSSRLRDTMAAPGIVCPEIMDLDAFCPRHNPYSADGFTVGRLSRDTPEKHHPDDPSLYRLLSYTGAKISIMGGLCLSGFIDNTPGIELLRAGSVPAADFLRTLDVFFYRTGPTWHEPSGRVVMEALSCGVPVVAHASGGYTDWIRNGENGFVFTSQEEAWDILCMLKENRTRLWAMQKAARAAAEDLAGPSARDSYVAWLRT